MLYHVMGKGSTITTVMLLFRTKLFFSSLQRFLSIRVRRNSTNNDACAARFKGPSLKDFVSPTRTEGEGAIEDQEGIPYVSSRDFAAHGRKG